MLMNRLSRSHSLVCLFLGCCAGMASAQEGYNNASLGSPGPEHPVYWCVTNTPRSDQRWAAEMDLGGLNLRRDVEILYQWRFGKFPYIGPHRHAMDPTWMDKHLEQVREDIDVLIPDPGFAGLAIIDYENWSLNWERTRNKPGEDDPFAIDQDYQDDWREYIRNSRSELLTGLDEAQQEQVFKETYEECAKEIYLATLAECRKARPNAKWSFFAYPVRRYRWRDELPQDVIGYGDLTHRASELNDELQWLWEAEDFLCPALYAPKFTIPEGQKRSNDGCEDWPSHFTQFLDSNMAEAERLANGKPVYPVISTHYTIEKRDFPWLSDRNLQLSFEAFLKNANGAIIWDNIKDQQYNSELQQYMLEHVAPVLLAVDPRLGSDDGSENAANDDGGGNDARSGGGKRAHAAVRPNPLPDYRPGSDVMRKPALTKRELVDALRRSKPGKDEK